MLRIDAPTLIGLALVTSIENPVTVGPAYVQFTVIVEVPCAFADVMTGVPNVVQFDVADDVAFVPVAVSVNEYSVFPPTSPNLNASPCFDSATNPPGVFIESEDPEGAGPQATASSLPF